ncbi:MAG: V-type ATPase subunit [Oscillospiraceae bacterium]|nr:V-type ATPase subunit [Oscillospiraceae bacterium]
MKEDYLYLSSLLRARETKMLSRDRAERMLDTAGFQDAAKLLTESGYEDMSGYSIREIEDALSARRASVFRELETLVPDPAALDLFRLRYDYHNAKVLIKAFAQNQDHSALLSDSGRVPPEVLKKRFQEDRLRDLPGLLGHAAEEAKGLLARSANPQLSDFVLDRAYFAEMKELAEELDSDFARGYVEILADATNLRSAVRIQRMGKDTGYLRESVVPGGSISEERILTGISGEGIAALFAGTGLAKAAALGADAVSGGTMTAFELACDNAVSAYLADARRASFGEECVMGYLAGVESELTTVRMILTGRLAGVPSETIRERLRDLYA